MNEQMKVWTKQHKKTVHKIRWWHLANIEPMLYDLCCVVQIAAALWGKGKPWWMKAPPVTHYHLTRPPKPIWVDEAQEIAKPGLGTLWTNCQFISSIIETPNLKYQDVLHHWVTIQSSFYRDFTTIEVWNCLIYKLFGWIEALTLYPAASIIIRHVL